MIRETFTAFLPESPSAGEPVPHPVIADLNEDGIPDVVGIGTTTSSLIVFLGSGNTFSAPIVAPISSTASRLIVADLNGDGRLDYLADDGTFAEGAGDGTFHVVRQINVRLRGRDRGGLRRRRVEGHRPERLGLRGDGPVQPRRRRSEPAAGRGRGARSHLRFPAQFAGTISLTALRSYDPNLDPLTYQWLDAAGVVRSTAVTLDIKGYAPGTYTFTLVVRDDRARRHATPRR